MNYFIQDMNVFYATIYGGILIGILFDINRSLKENFKIIKKTSFILDVLFWIVITLIVFIVVNTISKFILKFNNIVIGFIKLLIKKIILNLVTILENLYYIIVYSIHLLFDIIFYIPSIIFTIGRKSSRRPLVKRK